MQLLLAPFVSIKGLGRGSPRAVIILWLMRAIKVYSYGVRVTGEKLKKVKITSILTGKSYFSRRCTEVVGLSRKLSWLVRYPGETKGSFDKVKP